MLAFCSVEAFGYHESHDVPIVILRDLGIETWGPDNATKSRLTVKVPGRYCTALASTQPSFLRLNEDNVTVRLIC